MHMMDILFMESQVVNRELLKYQLQLLNNSWHCCQKKGAFRINRINFEAYFFVFQIQEQ